MGKQASKQAITEVSDIVNQSINEVSNSSEVKSSNEIFQDAQINMTVSGNKGPCHPHYNVIVDQQATIASINKNTATVSQNVTTKILNKAETLAKQGSLQTQAGLLKVSNQDSKQTIVQIQNQKTNIENILKSTMKSIINQSASQKGVINFTDTAYYPCFVSKSYTELPKDVLPMDIGVKALSSLVANNSSESIVDALANTNLKNSTSSIAGQTNKQTSKGLLAALGGIFSKTFIIIAAVIGGICLLACLAMMLMGHGPKSLSEMKDSLTTLPPTDSVTTLPPAEMS
jgi:hypothetical protein